MNFYRELACISLKYTEDSAVLQLDCFVNNIPYGKQIINVKNFEEKKGNATTPHPPGHNSTYGIFSPNVVGECLECVLGV